MESVPYERSEWISLDNFLTTHPALKKMARWFLEHPTEALNAADFSQQYGQPVAWLDLKGLAVNKVLTPLDARGQVVELPWVIDANTRFRVNTSLSKLIEDVLAKVKPGPRPETVYPEQPEKGNTGGRTWTGWKVLPKA